MDTLIKMVFSYFPIESHEYFGFPGNFESSIKNEIPSSNGMQKRTDVSYCINNNGVKQIMDVEDETSPITVKTLLKSNIYSVNLEYLENCPVNTAFTIDIPLDKCIRELSISETKTLTPIISSFGEEKGVEKLNSLTERINAGETFTTVESLDLLFVIRMFDKIRI